MPADGVSLPTTLAQMGTVAKAQARGQHGTQQASPFHEQQDQKDDLKVQRVHEAKAAEQGRVEPDEDRKDKRQRRRLRRTRRQGGAPEDDTSGTADAQEAAAQAAETTLGATIDLRI
jgi:hypothetical protein